MPKRIRLIANPISGGDARPRIQQAVTLLEQAGAQVDLFLTGKRGDAREEAARLPVEDYDLVLAAGGDGTLNEVANGLVGRGLPLAFLPLGTANVMALEMGIPLRVAAACRIALKGEARPVALAAAGDDLFLMMAGIGFDAAAVRAVHHRIKHHTGKLAYVIAGLSALLSCRDQPLRLQSQEGPSYKIYHAIISNIRYYGGRFLMAPNQGLEQPALTACLVERPGRMALLLFFLRILLRGRLFGPVRRITSTSFRLDGGTVPVQVDGDDFGDTPLEIHSRPACLDLIFPTKR